jgi:hypothetical protein
MIEVTKDEFFTVVGALNVHPRPERDTTYWELPNHTLVGTSTPGYMADAPHRYWLEER